MEIKVKDHVDQESYNKVVELLVDYNRSKTTELKDEINKPIEIIVRDEDGEIIGGLYGRSIWGTLEIKTLIVKAENRTKGIGYRLLEEAEKEAKKRNCRYMSLDTFSFQAPDFYEKCGFKKFATEPDFPKGFERYYYRKEL